MIKKKNTLKYACVDNRFQKLSPIKNSIPDWYKEMSQYQNGDKTLRFLPQRNLTIKHCLPFLDALTSGYQIPLHTDLLVKQFPDGPQLSWGESSRPPVGPRDSSLAPNFPMYNGFATNQHFVWHHTAVIKLPKGYSALYTHPLNRYDLPFLTLSAVVDNDWAVGNGNVPFFISDTFEGVIPKGTPIIQVIPFKRESWYSKEEPSLLEENATHLFNSISTLSGWYKKTFWNKKTFD